MTMLSDLPHVSSCSATACGYNHDGCHAGAITVEGNAASCSTFLPLGIDGGLPKVIASVGACKRVDCVHNESAVCTAASVRISGGEGTTHCETFAQE
ncbi:DUF1540 domain-containing protein [Humidisolicoccus flavus]|uniref:DUF1540 domain-containing protein n=1 Tax=Humidisolicoccus flavus TaxID=3111414 RepID=UPI00324640D2